MLRLCWMLFPLLLSAQTVDEAGAIFVKHVRPLLREKCAGCHGPALQSNGLSLTSRDALLMGGKRGPAIVPGDAAHSLIVSALEQTSALKMPPGQKLPAESAAAVRRWIELGAPWVEEAPTTANWKLAPADVWEFQPLSHPEVPAGSGSPVDAFITAKLREMKLTPAPRAGRATLLRRATFDLIGLAPTPDEMRDFLRDPAPYQAAFRKVVERLLASPRYGERWGRHWLDVVRYADTGGYSNDFERPTAWRYRDYVIRSFNSDKPYDQFAREQLAGDEIDPKDPEKLIATGFLRMGPWEHTGMSVAAETRQAWLDDVTHTTAATFLGLTMECARCHDHKFDPLPTKDYYRLQAVFATTEFADRQAPFLPGESRPDFEAGRARLARLQQMTDAKMTSYDDLVKQRLVAKKGVKSIDEISKDEVTKVVRSKELLTPEEFERMKIYQKRRELYNRSATRYDALAYSVKEGADAETFILPVGNLKTPGEKVTPGVLNAVYVYDRPAHAEVPMATAGRRLALANWVANRENPLTARVMANRIWAWHFGRGIAANPNNLGKLGEKPTHPELLDWLANYFIAHGWSVKEMHRAIMLTDAYQRQAGQVEQDPDNRWLSHFSPRRLESEELRDAILEAAGELSTDAGGPGTFPEINEDVMRQPQQIMGTLMPAYRPSPTRAERNRRTIYTFQKRNLIDPFLDVFNGASLNESTEKRGATTVPTQVFALFNSSFVHDMALAFAARVEKAGGDRIETAYRYAFNRAPREAEKAQVREYLQKMTAMHRADAPAPPKDRKPLVRSITSELTGNEVKVEEDADPVAYEENLQPGAVGPETRALADLALVLFNSNEFVYVY
jgi:hypothetical protein